MIWIGSVTKLRSLPKNSHTADQNDSNAAHKTTDSEATSLSLHSYSKNAINSFSSFNDLTSTFEKQRGK